MKEGGSSQRSEQDHKLEWRGKVTGIRNDREEVRQREKKRKEKNRIRKKVNDSEEEREVERDKAFF